MVGAEGAGLAALVLAGGESRRMGTDKAALHYGEGTLLEHVVTVVAGVIEDVFVGIRPEQSGEPTRARFHQVCDDPDFVGPIAAIFAAHRRRPASAWLVVGCDMAWLEADIIEALVEARDGAAMATAFQVDSGLEPLCAIYEPDNLSRLADHVGSGKSPGPRWLLERVPVRFVPLPPGGRLASANFPADLDSGTR